MELRWVPVPTHRGTHELLAGDRRLAALELVGTRGIARSGLGRWQLERDITRTVRVWDIADGTPIAELTRATWTCRRRLIFSDGSTVHWEPTSFWRSGWRFRDADGWVVESRRARGGPRSAADLWVAETRRPPAQLTVMAVLCRYLTLVTEADDAATASAAVIGSLPPPV
jgi:hypothetical protein